MIPRINLKQPLGQKDVLQLKEDFDYVIIAAGAQKPRNLSIPGSERAVTALDFLQAAKRNKIRAGKKVVIIGAGNGYSGTGLFR